MRTRILCLPPVDAAAAAAGLSTLEFYLRDLDIEVVTIVTTDGPIDMSSIQAPLAGRVVVYASADTEVRSLVDSADVLVTWGSEDAQDWNLPTFALHNDGSLDDHRSLITLAAVLRSETRRNASSSLRKATRLREQLAADTVACVLVDSAAEINIDHPLLLIIADGFESLDRARIGEHQILVCLPTPERYLPSPSRAADPLPHLLGDDRTSLVIPDWAYAAFVRTWPGYADRTFSPPANAVLPAGADLQSRFAVCDERPPAISLLLPLAEFMSNRIRIAATNPIAGSDDEWATALLAIERRGSSVSVVGQPDQRELRRRRTPDLDLKFDVPKEPDYLLVSVNPDWVDELGHHAHFDRALSEAVDASGGVLISLTSAALRATEREQIPTFTHSTYGFRMAESAVFAERFERELRGALSRLVATFPNIPIRVAMYSASLAHQIALIKTASELSESRVSFFINLLRAHNELLDMEIDPSPSFESQVLQLALDLGPAVGVYTLVDSEELRKMLETRFGHRLPIWPMVGVTPLADDADKRTPGSPVVVCYPATQEIKGLQTFTELAEALADADGTTAMKLIARDTGHQPEWTERLTAAGVELIPGVLEPDTYARFMKSADIVVLPYRTRPFRIQTSGVFADAVRLRRPAVATRSTWAGRLIDEHGIGATFSEGDVEAFKKSVLDVARNYAEYQERMVEFAPRWLENNNPAALLRAFEQIEAGASDPIPDLDGATVLRSLRQVVEGEARRRALDRAKSAEQAVLTVSDLNTTIERLEQRVSTRDRAVSRFEDRLAETRVDRDRKLANLSDRITRYETRLETQDRKLAQLRESVDHHKARLESVLADYDTTTRNLRARIETRRKTIGNLKQAITQRDEKLATNRDAYERRIGVLKEGIEKRDTTIAALNRRLSVRLGKALRRLTGRGN